MLSLLRSWRMLMTKLEVRAHWQVESRLNSMEHPALISRTYLIARRLMKNPGHLLACCYIRLAYRLQKSTGPTAVRMTLPLELRWVES